jgi:hypothetical protein
VVKEDATRETNDRGLKKKSERRVRQWEVAVGNLAEGDALGGVEDVTEIEEDGDVRVLPQDDAGGRSKKRRSRNPVGSDSEGAGSGAPITIRDDSNRPSAARKAAP